MIRAILWSTTLAILSSQAVAQSAKRQKIEDLPPEKVEAIVKELEAACRKVNETIGARAYDDCIRNEARKRGYY